MADAITRWNEKARRRAADAGRLTYTHEVVESWPACVECGRPIRARAFERDRRCGCPGVRWSCTTGGWERRTSGE